MSTENDTDPSSPVQARGPDADTDPGPPSRPSSPVRVTTQRGLAPPSRPPADGAPPPPVPVAAAAAVDPKKDSVELLLEGLQGPVLERPRIAPQTDGQSSAAYHTKHAVQPAHTEPGEQPSVVVERPPMAPTMKIDRQKLDRAIEVARAARQAGKAAAAQPKEPPVTLGPRVVMAMVAGLGVVLVLFLVARASVEGHHAPPEAPAAPPAPSAAQSSAADTPPAATWTAVPVSSAPATASVASPSAPPPAPPPSSTRPRSRTGATGAPGDLGEFKTTFH